MNSRRGGQTMRHRGAVLQWLTGCRDAVLRHLRNGIARWHGLIGACRSDDRLSAALWLLVVLLVGMLALSSVPIPQVD